MVGLISLLVVAGVAFAVVRFGATALERTGLSRDAARFQAISAFFGAGFTTGESELVVTHPVRRRVIRDLIIVGNLGLTGALGAFVVTFMRAASPGEQGRHLLIMVLGLGVLWWLSRSRLALRLVDRSVARFGPASLVHAHDYSELLHLHVGYGVDEVRVEPGCEVEGRSLAELGLRSRQGVVVLGIDQPSGEFNPIPDGETRLRAGDRLVVYGHDDRVVTFARACARAKAEPDGGAAGSIGS